SIEPHALVLGGGVAGLRATVDIGSRGFNVTLVEKESKFGGYLKNLSVMYPNNEKADEEAGLNRYCFEQVNLREHVSWCHAREPKKATMKADDLVRMSTARASLLKSLEIKTVSIEPHALVLGGGVA
ncbi:unnamed protein product, partial [marine sediment metagenome]